MRFIERVADRKFIIVNPFLKMKDAFKSTSQICTPRNKKKIYKTIKRKGKIKTRIETKERIEKHQ